MIVLSGLYSIWFLCYLRVNELRLCSQLVSIYVSKFTLLALCYQDCIQFDFFIYEYTFTTNYVYAVYWFLTMLASLPHWKYVIRIIFNFGFFIYEYTFTTNYVYAVDWFLTMLAS